MSLPHRPEPLVLRHSGRRWRFRSWFLMWNVLHIAVLVGCPVLLVVTRSYGLLIILPTLIFWLFLTYIPHWTGLGGHTVVDAYGVTRRHGRAEVRIPWAEVEKIAVVPRAPGSLGSPGAGSAC